MGSRGRRAVAVALAQSISGTENQEMTRLFDRTEVKPKRCKKMNTLSSQVNPTGEGCDVQVTS